MLKAVLIISALSGVGDDHKVPMETMEECLDARAVIEKQLDQAIGRQTEINTRVDGLNQQLFEYETEIVEVSNSANICSLILKYMRQFYENFYLDLLLNLHI